MSSSSVQRVFCSDEEIEEEIINDDLKCLGVKEDLKSMDLQEKKNLLSAIKQSTEETSPGSSDTADIKPVRMEAVSPNNSPESTRRSISSSPGNSPLNKNDYPELSTPGSARRPHNTLRLPKLMSSVVSGTQKLSATSQDGSETLPFCLPFCMDDRCPPLVMPKKNIFVKKNVYHRKQGETSSETVERMLSQHDEWKKKLEEMLTLQKLSTLDIIDTENKHENGEAETTPNKQSTPAETTPKKQSTPADDRDNETLLIKEYATGSSSKRWISTAENSTPKAKTWNERENKRQRSNRKRGKILEQGTSSVPNVDFDFTEKWNPQTGTWSSSPSPAKSKNFYKRQTGGVGDNPKVEVVTEKKVQCPICQVHFLQSKVETHAAECEGFISDPVQGVDTDQEIRVTKSDKGKNELQEVCVDEEISQNSTTKRGN